ncbi:HIT domain protein [Blumeria hordei DH14]|uniref:HIT domain protein n=1 Tax=Blumeria graminis f. sp. hordei (strain DH14) TaxID=546991 RepID=N1JBP9_BLUG1|nr:HIT domain protein [Blumeria hordei DH14]
MQDCPFCYIEAHFPPALEGSIKSHSNTTGLPAFVVLSTPLCLAFLDIRPLSPGHLLLTTRQHREKVSDLTEEESSELGVWLSRLSRVLATVTNIWDWNIIQNNGAAAAQVVRHVHFHIIPRPELTPESRNKSFTMFGKGYRSDLNHNEAMKLTESLKDELDREMRRLKKQRL